VSQFETFMARDGHEFQVYIASPAGRPRGAVVLAHEEFGLTHAMRGAADGFAAAGYLVMAPALFDRIRHGLVLGYTAAEVEQARGYCAQIGTGAAVRDIGAVAAVARHAGKVAVLGYGWGARIAWAAAAARLFAAAVCHDGIGLAAELPAVPSCPALVHVAVPDPSRPPVELEQLRSAFPQGVYELYAADPGFANRDRPTVYNAVAAELALARSQAFLAQHVG
jgi:carboxymethylenebutenolidase